MTRRISIRHAILSDLDSVKHLADANHKSLGFVIRSALVAGIEKQWLIVADYQGEIVEFAHYRHRQDNQTTLYELCVQSEYRGQGIGKALINHLQSESQDIGKTILVLKMPIDLPASIFYERIGFVRREIEPGRKRVLQVWYLSW